MILESIWDFPHSPSVKTCNTIIPYHVYLYAYMFRAGIICRVFAQLGIKSGTNLGEAHCYSKANACRFCNVTWSNLPALRTDGLISDVRQSHHKERIGQEWL